LPTRPASQPASKKKERPSGSSWTSPSSDRGGSWGASVMRTAGSNIHHQQLHKLITWSCGVWPDMPPTPLSPADPPSLWVSSTTWSGKNRPQWCSSHLAAVLLSQPSRPSSGLLHWTKVHLQNLACSHLLYHHLCHRTAITCTSTTSHKQATISPTITNSSHDNPETTPYQEKTDQTTPAEVPTP